MTEPLGPALRRALIAYWERLDEELQAAGFADHGFPDGRVLRICLGDPEATVSRIGRQLGITRQGAGKVVASLRERGYVTLTPSSDDGRENVVRLTDRASEFLLARRRAVKKIECQVRKQAGDEALEALKRIVTALGGDGQSRIGDYLRLRDVASLVDPDA